MTAEPTLMLVDDEIAILRVFKRILSSHPYRVLTAKSATEALQILAEKQVTLLISDAEMPDMDGLELLAQARRANPAIICVLMSGHSELSSAVRAINEGRIHRYLSKPCTATELLGVIEAGFEAATLQEQHLSRLKSSTTNSAPGDEPVAACSSSQGRSTID